MSVLWHRRQSPLWVLTSPCLRQGFLLFDITHARLADPQASGDSAVSAFHLTVEELGTLMHAAAPASRVFWESTLRSSCLHGKHFAHKSVSSTLNFSRWSFYITQAGLELVISWLSLPQSGYLGVVPPPKGIYHNCKYALMVVISTTLALS